MSEVDYQSLPPATAWHTTHMPQAQMPHALTQHSSRATPPIKAKSIAMTKERQDQLEGTLTVFQSMYNLSDQDIIDLLKWMLIQKQKEIDLDNDLPF